MELALTVVSATPPGVVGLTQAVCQDVGVAKRGDVKALPPPVAHADTIVSS